MSQQVRTLQSQRLQRIGAYLFADLDRKQEALQAKGVDVINLGVGDPDLPTPPHIIQALEEGARDPRSHRYPPYVGTAEFRKAVAAWFGRRFGVSLDANRQVLALIGSKEGLAHLPWAMINPGEVTLVPDPGYPVYRSSTIMAEGEPVSMPLREEGTVLQVLIVATGFIVPAMFFLGVVFGALWGTAIWLGRKVGRAQPR